MERLQPQTEQELREAVKRAARVLSAGGLVIYPTDTVYGIGADASNEAAVEKVYALKGRDAKKPLSVVVSDMRMALTYTRLHEAAERLIKRILPGPFTLLVESRGKLAPNLTQGSSLLGIRIPDSFFCVSLAQVFGKPYTATSANASGEVAGDVDEILEQFKESEGLIDLVVDVGPLDQTLPSTILDISGDAVVVVREGARNTQAVQLVTLQEQE